MLTAVSVANTQAPIQKHERPQHSAVQQLGATGAERFREARHW